MVEELKTSNHHNNNIRLGFYKNPNTPRIFNTYEDSSLREIFGLHHMKLYIFDNDVMISGANLSESYFTTRIDRYYYF